MVYAIDLHGRLIYFNARAVEVLGYDASDAKRFLGAPFFDIIAPGSHGLAADTMRRGAKRPLDVHTFRIDVRRKDGSVVTAEVQASPLWQDGEVVGRVGVARLIDRESHATDADTVERAIVTERERIAQAVRERLADVFADAEVSSAGTGRHAEAVEVFRRHGLDETDLAILRLVTTGASNPEIGRQVHLSAAAVKDRVGRLMATVRRAAASRAVRPGAARRHRLIRTPGLNPIRRRR